MISLVLPARSGDFTPSEDALRSMQAIGHSSLMSHIRFLSHDLLEGRAPGTRGDLLSQTYIASQMELIGLKPGAEDGSYFQQVPVISMTADPSMTFRISGDGSELLLEYRKDFVAVAGKQQEEISVKDAEIVFVGYGIDAPEQNWDDYKGVDVRGKILLMMNNDPAPDDPKEFAGKARLYYGRWTYKYEIAARKGAIGAIIIHTRESAGYGWNVVESSWSGEQFELGQDPSAATSLINGWTTLEATRRILEKAGVDYDELIASALDRSFKPVPLGVALSTSIKTRIRKVMTTNVLGLLPGSDPELKKEVVIYSAHYDHLGVGNPVAGDSIHNGALDNATGVSALLNIAAAFTYQQTPPRRSLLFAAVGAEESGLIGSKYYAEHPTFPPGRIAANINMDGLNIFGPTRDVIMVGLGKSSMDDVLKKVADWQGRVVKPDQFPEQGFFYRSDQFNFAKIGVPCMYLEAGMEYIGKPENFGKEMVEEYIQKHYHQPSDEIADDWVLTGAVEDVQLMYLVGHIVADQDAMPVWNKGDEFEAARKRALGKTE
ncbi:MAG: M28 family peptidase [Ignavibacteria bacterium]|nr:M28 family peptidase [Ignavibacteria bacterium]